MNTSDRHAIEELFGKLDDVERSNAGVERDAETEVFNRLIGRDHGSARRSGFHT